jgi:hypothetical protein|tara:strand:+ start:993 stop:1133 length:141 start_codon:yes stop_codon:yes gene_type:complete
MAEKQNVEYGLFEMPKKEDWEENMTEKEKMDFVDNIIRNLAKGSKK